MRLSVIIVSYQAAAELELCLWAACQAVEQMDAEIIVIDNASAGPSIQALADYFSQLNPPIQKLSWIWNTTNKGFGAACNQAAAQATGEYLLFLNPDTLIEPEGLKRALAFLQMQPQAGALGPYLLNGRGRFLKESRRGFPTPWNSLCKILGLAGIFPRSRLLAGYYAGNMPVSYPQPTAVLCGACMLIPRNAWEAIRGFDETFFLYAEDTDLCLRLHQKGYLCYFFPDWKVLHLKYRSMRNHPKQHRYYFFQSMKIYVHKHFPHHQWYLLPAIEWLYRISRFSRKFQYTTHQKHASSPKTALFITRYTHVSSSPIFGDRSVEIRPVNALHEFCLSHLEQNTSSIILNIQDFPIADCFNFLQNMPRAMALCLLTPYTQSIICV